MNNYKNINFIDDATIVNEFGFYNIDDEGNTSKKLPLIKNGKIVNYLCDERGKKILLQKFSSSCRRETYYNKFSSRMSNTYIEKGNCEVKDIVTSVENGFYIKNILFLSLAQTIFALLFLFLNSSSHISLNSYLCSSSL